ncbi:hypothetical protein ACFE04_013633 [Oxalis oulophora]
MSGAKRPHEESGHSSSSKYPHEDSSQQYPKVTSSGVPSDNYHHPPPYDMVHNPRLPKISRSETRDADRRSPLNSHSVHRALPSSASDSHLDFHPAIAESRLLESKDLKDVRDSHSGKGERDVKFEIRGDDLKYDRDNDVKMDKGSSHLSWKDSKEHHRGGKRFNEAAPPSGNMDQWHVSRGVSEIVKEGQKTEEKDYVEAREAVGENKLDRKGEDRFKDKDRKRKDLKHADWAEKDKEIINNSSATIQIGTDPKEPSKDKDVLKEKEKDNIKQGSWTGVEKEGEKESIDATVKDIDPSKTVDVEARLKRKERDGDQEGDGTEKQSRGFEKESDDGSPDGEGFNYGVQQRKRMLRPRGSPQLANREPRFRPRAEDNEGSQGKSMASSVVYKVGECMQELIKLWKEYEASQADKNGESSQNGPTLEIRIPAEHVTATNHQVRGGQLWGTDIYTNDSDLVAGYCRPTASLPSPTIQELRVTVRILPPQDCYTSTLRNNVRSRAWGTAIGSSYRGGASIGCSYRVERCCIVKKGGGSIDLEPCLTYTSAVEPTLAPVAVERSMTTRAAASNALRQQRFVREVTIQYNLCNEPWTKYSISIVADKGLKKPLYTCARLKKGEVLYLETRSCRYELCFAGEKMAKATVASQLNEGDLDKSQNHLSNSTNGDKNDPENILIDTFRWSRCKKVLPEKDMFTTGIPLPLELVEVLEENVDWEDVQWSQTGVWIAGKEYPVARAHFLSSK